MPHEPALPYQHTTALLLTIRNHNFIDNTEYFNKIMEGETIFGLHFCPSLSLQIAQYMGLDIGFVWKKYFGQIKPWNGMAPILSTYYKNKHSVFVIGVFYLKDYQPTLIEPLCSPHHLLRKPFMEGIHFRAESDTAYLAGWLDWLTLLSKKKSRPETFRFYLDGGFQLSKIQQTLDFKIPFQLAICHLGGQGIPIKSYSLFAGAGGLLLAFMPPDHFIEKITCAGYILLNKYAKKIDRPSKMGRGQLYTFDCTMRSIALSLSYWHGANFSSENMGHPLYQSIRIQDNKVTHHEPSRKLLSASLHKKWTLPQDVTIEAIFRPYYDLNNQLLEYGLSFGLSYSGNFRLTTLHADQ
ncbi:hypothetical protein [Cardinium endosymbiont of Tipula unca]|uniref:hypothetical protein n=1 Tax=Cardinium endosymbiont of Tipula unca TaxID=3066216 RepID=UPI0030CEEE84